MKRTSLILYFLISLLIGIGPIKAGVVNTIDGPIAVTGGTFKLSQSAGSMIEYPHGISFPYYQYRYNGEHHSAIVPASDSAADELASAQTTSSGHALPATLARLYDHDYDAGAFCAFNECLIAPGSTVA